MKLKKIVAVTIVLFVAGCGDSKLELNSEESAIVTELCRQQVDWQQEKIAKLLEIESYNDQACENRFTQILELNSKGDTTEGKRGKRMASLISIRDNFYRTTDLKSQIYN